MDKKAQAMRLSRQIHELSNNLIEELNSRRFNDFNSTLKIITELKSELYLLYPELKDAWG